MTKVKTPRRPIVGIDRSERIVANFWRKVDKNGPEPTIPGVVGRCWLWTAATTGENQYGVFCGGGGERGKNGAPRLVPAHRYSYQLHRGNLPVEIDADHKCRVRLCVNPDHLQPLTRRENVLAGNAPTSINARLTECRRGHPFDNILKKSGWRHCSQCQRLRDQARGVRRREASQADRVRRLSRVDS